MKSYFCFSFANTVETCPQDFLLQKENFFWSPRSHWHEVLILRTAGLDKRERVKGAGSLGQTNAVSSRMISIERVTWVRFGVIVLLEFEKAEKEMRTAFIFKWRQVPICLHSFQLWGICIFICAPEDTGQGLLMLLQGWASGVLFCRLSEACICIVRRSDKEYRLKCHKQIHTLNIFMTHTYIALWCISSNMVYYMQYVEQIIFLFNG